MTWFPTAALVLPLQGNPHAFVSRAGWNNNGIDAALSDELPLLSREIGDATLQFGVGAGVYMHFEPAGELTFHMETVDGIFAFPLDVRVGDWSGRMMWSHLSGHFADGIRRTERVPTPAEIESFSREALHLQVSRVFSWFRPTLGGWGLLHAVDGGEGVGVFAGLDVEQPGAVGGFGAAYFSMAGEHDWSPSSAGKIGLRTGEIEGRGVRLAVAGYTGRNPSGKWSSENVRQLGIEFSFDTR